MDAPGAVRSVAPIADPFGCHWAAMTLWVRVRAIVALSLNAPRAQPGCTRGQNSPKIRTRSTRCRPSRWTRVALVPPRVRVLVDATILKPELGGIRTYATALLKELEAADVVDLTIVTSCPDPLQKARSEIVVVPEAVQRF